MKKICLIMFMFLFFIVNTYAEEKENLIKNATNGVLMEMSTGQILYEKDKDKRVSVASMTKMVAQIIILENIENGNISWDEKITVSSNAAGMGGSQIYLQTGEIMTVRDLMKGITMASANDATVAMAERIGGTEENFVKLMNNKVKELGLKNTHFVNPTGLDADNHYSSAYDMAVIARELLNHEEILKFSSIYEDYLRQNTENKFWLVNTNKLVRFYDGADGLKTGFTDNAKYCMAVTAKRDNMRIIAIVLGENSSKVRNQETMDLLDYGFNLYKINLLHDKNKIIKNINIDKSDKEKIEIYPLQDVTILNKKSDVSLNYNLDLKLNDISLPLKKGDIVGKILINNNNKIVKEVDAIVGEDVNKVGYIRLFINTLSDLLSGGFNQ